MKDTIDIERLYETMSRRLYNASLRITGSSADAEEIMHDTLLQYWRFRRKHEIQNLSRWLSSVCIRKSIDRLRERNRWKCFIEAYEAPLEYEEEEGAMEYDPGRIRDALSSLPDHYRVIVSLHLLEGFDYQEISQITGSNESTIRSLYMRGRQKLAAELRNKKS